MGGTCAALHVTDKADHDVDLLLLELAKHAVDLLSLEIDDHLILKRNFSQIIFWTNVDLLKYREFTVWKNRGLFLY